MNHRQTRRTRISLCTLFLLLSLTQGSLALPTGSPSTEGLGRARQQVTTRAEILGKDAGPPANTQPHGERSPTENEEQLVDEVLMKYGYFRKGKQLHLQQGELRDLDSHDHKRRARDAEMSASDRTEAIRRFQSFFGLPLSGVADWATVSLMKKGRCGVADIPAEEGEDAMSGKPQNLMANNQMPSDYVLLGSKWHNNTLTWWLENPSKQLLLRDQLKILQDAFDLWAQVTPLKFQQKVRRDSAVDISIGFVRMSHGDDYPFDGQGKVLAHAFGPGEVPISGDMHFDNDERWSLDPDSGGSSLFLVATHELGHSLGLGHSRDPDALMYPYYGLTGALGQDDIKAIQYLYGKRIGTLPEKPDPRTKKPVTPRPTYSPATDSTTPFHQWKKSAVYAPACEVIFDVVFQDDSKRSDVYTGIQGDAVYRFNQHGVLAGYPSTLNKVYPGAPNNADAIFGLQEKAATYFIKGNRVWRFRESRMDLNYPKDLNPAHFLETVRYVLPATDTGGNQRIFVFGNTVWMEYNFDELPSQKPSFHNIQHYWPHVATDVMYAVTGYDGNMYFISPQSHVVLNRFRQVMHGGKQMGHPYWLQTVCEITSGSRSLYSLGSLFAVAFLATFVPLL